MLKQGTAASMFFGYGPSIEEFAETYDNLALNDHQQYAAQVLPNSQPVFNPILLDEILAYARTLENVVPANGIRN